MTKKRVAVALSGGVDSSAAALLLKEAGHEIIGIHMSILDSPHFEHQAHQAELICHILGIPFHIVNLQREFDLYVVDYFCQEYRHGRTPNPCIACNRYIKFGFLLQKALSLSTDYLATGHYAGIEHSDDSYHLLKGVDRSKDQSYFLYTLSREKLKHILFPLGDYTKAEVRQIAQRGGLPVTIKPSQDACFISQKNCRTFLNQRVSGTPGDIVDVQGRILGRHQGIVFYTIGQRHGLGLASGKPLYVIKIEPEHNRIVLGEEKELYSRKVTAQKLSWVADELPSVPITITAKIRYRSRQASAILFPKGESATILFARSQRAVTPGQAIVFYKGAEVLGGGTISNGEIKM